MKNKIFLLILAVISVIAGISLINNEISQPPLETIADKISQYFLAKEREADQLSANGRLLEKMATNNLNEYDLLKLQKQKENILLYHDANLVFWSKNESIPGQDIFLSTNFSEVIRLKNGFFYITKRNPVIHDDSTFTLVQLIPVKYKYALENKHLQSKISVELDINNIIDFSLIEDESTSPVFGPQGDIIAYIYYKSAQGETIPSQVGIFLILAGMILLLIFFNSLAIQIGKSTHSMVGFLFLAGMFSLLHFFLITQFYPSYLSGTLFFDPKYYAASKIVPSMGNLLAMLILLFWLALYFFKEVRFNYKMGRMNSIFLSITGNFAIILTLVYISRVIRSLVLDSHISFNVNDFLSLNLYSFLGLLSIAFMVAAFYLFAYRILKTNQGLISSRTDMAISLGVAMALAFIAVYLTAPGFRYVVIFGGTFILSLIFFIRKKVAFLSFYSVMFWLIFFSFFTSMYINIYNTQKEIEKRKLFALTIAQEQDVLAEYLFGEISREIQNDKFLQGYFQNPFIPRNTLLERIQLQYFKYHLNKYNVVIHTYRYPEVPYKNATPKSLSEFRGIAQAEGGLSSVENLYYFSNSAGNYQYLAFVDIAGTEKSNPAGTLVIEFIPKTFSFSNVYPELLLEENLKPPADFLNYNYAIYLDNRLVKNRGEFAYNLKTNLLYEQEYVEFSDGEYNHLVYTPKAGQSIWITSQRNGYLQPISLFSYIFCIFLLILMVFLAGRYLYLAYLNRDNGQSFGDFSFRNKIQFFVIFIIVISFVLIGTLTVYNINRQYEDYHRSRLLRKSKQVMAGLEYLKVNVDTDGRSWKGIFEKEEWLFPQVVNLADVHSMDINIYDLNGDLVTTSQPSIFEKGLISTKVDPVAFHNIVDLQKSQFFKNENIGNLHYLSTYLPLLNSEREVTGILNLPYFAKDETMEAEINDFLTYFINVYVLLLVIAGVIGVVVSNSITRPLSEVGNKLKQVALGRRNEPITWNNKDEIGKLVDEYNRMIEELEKSAELLAKSERETAWREMAKQVAHEIKNPLTPMKLGVQHLQRASRDQSPDINKLIERVTSTLIEQIENLSSIASEFSSFAKMPAPKKEVLNLNEVVKSVIALYQNQEDVLLKYSIPQNQYLVYADKGQIIRVFNNLVKNAIQAIPDEREGEIFIALAGNRDKVTVKIEDNGIGISQEQREAVFVPNFTTKGSGMGLGLAMSKNIIEFAEGKIWFTSQKDRGTTFYVELPLVSMNSLD